MTLYSSPHCFPPSSSRCDRTGLKKNVTLLQTAVQTSQLRLINRVLRNNTPFRRNLRPSILSEAISYYLPQDEPLKALGLAILADLPDDPLPPPPPPPASSLPSTSSSTMEMDKDEKSGRPSQASAGKKAFPAPLFLPETTTYLLLLVLTTAMRLHRLEQAHSVATALLPYLRKQNRRTLDALAAKGYFYLALTQERRSQSLAPLRPLFVALHRTACLHHDEMGQATLLNLLLRSLLADNLIEQAGNLIARTSFPEVIVLSPTLPPLSLPPFLLPARTDPSRAPFFLSSMRAITSSAGSCTTWGACGPPSSTTRTPSPS